MKKVLSLIAFLVGSLFSHAKDGVILDKPYDAPAVSALDHDGKAINFADEYKKGVTVVYFYPKADTPGCTKQGCSLRDAYADLTGKGVHVLGVSVDKPEANKAFRDKFKFPFTLVSDPDGKVCEAFKVSRMPVVGLATRQAFLIKDGKVVWHDAKASTDQQAADILAVLTKLK